MEYFGSCKISTVPAPTVSSFRGIVRPENRCTPAVPNPNFVTIDFRAAYFGFKNVVQTVAVWSEGIRNVHICSSYLEHSSGELLIEDSQRNRIPLEYPRQAPLAADEVLIDKVTFDIRNLNGSNAVWMEVNPIDRTTDADDQIN